MEYKIARIAFMGLALVTAMAMVGPAVGEDDVLTEDAQAWHPDCLESSSTGCCYYFKDTHLACWNLVRADQTALEFVQDPFELA